MRTSTSSSTHHTRTMHSRQPVEHAMRDVKITDPKMSKATKCNTPTMFVEAKVRVRFIKKKNGQLSYLDTRTIITDTGDEPERLEVNGGLEYTVALESDKRLNIKVENTSINFQFVHGGTRSTTQEVDEQTFVEATIVSWGNIEGPTREGRIIKEVPRLVEAKKVSGNLTTVVYTIGDAMSFTEFIMVLRCILADHQESEDILDKFSINLSSSREHPVLTKQRAEQPSSWLHVKLQVEEKGKKPSWTTLIMRDDNLYVCGFMNRKGKLYKLVDDNTQSAAMIPGDDGKNLEWTVSYISLLGDTGDEVGSLNTKLDREKLEKHKEEVVSKLVKEKLDRDFAMKAVRRLSGTEDPNVEVADMISCKLALGGLIVLVCESARMNPLHDSFAHGWSTGGGFKEELMRNYVWRHYYGETSGKLRKWKSKNYYANLKTIPQLQTMHLVLNAQEGNNDDGNPDTSTSGDAGGNAGNQNNNGNNNGNAGDKEGNDDGNSDPSTSSEEDGDAGGSSDDSKNTGEADDTLGHGRRLVELLAVHADLGVVGGTKIIVFDGKRGQIIYRHAKQGEEGTTEDLVLTGPYRGISAYGSFTIKVDIPNADPARFEWDCYLPRNAKQVDAVKPSDGDIRDPNDNSKVLAKVTYAVMSNALEATVKQVMLRLKDDGHTLNDVHGEIKARIDGFEVGSILFKQTQGAGQCFSRDGDSWFLLQLARKVVAVPCGKVLHIEVDLKTETSNDQGPMPLTVALKFDNGTLSQSSQDNGNEVKVDIAWYPEISGPSHPPEQTSEEMGEKEFITALPEPSDPADSRALPLLSPQKSHPAEVKTVVYTIGDAMSFTEFIMVLRRILADHKDREDILDKFPLINLSRQHHPVLAKLHGEPSWLHVKLQVVEEGKEPSWTTLIMRVDNLYVCGFMNQNGKLYRLVDRKTKSEAMIPRGDHNDIEDLEWTVSYTSILGDDAVSKLVEAELGRDFAVKAVRRLSSPEHHPDDDVAGMISGKLALGGLIVLVCESARMNPLHDSFAHGWSTGGGFKEELMRNYVWEYGRTSGELRKWKSENYYANLKTIPQLQTMHLVLNAPPFQSCTGHGRPLVELLAVRANLSVVGTKIIVLDRKRGQIIYSHAKQGEEGRMADLVLTGPYRGISAYGSFTIKVDIPNADPARFEWDCYLPRNAKQVDAVKPSDGDIRDPNDNSKVLAKVTYAVMSNALEATVKQVMLRLKDGHTLIGIHGEIKARIDARGFEVGSILFNPTQGAGQCFCPAGDSWFLLQLARNVVAVPCGKVLHIEVDLKMETSNGQGPKPLTVALKFDNGTLSRSSPDDNGNEVRVDIAWYPEISRPSHPPEQTSEEMGEQEPSHPVEAKMMSGREPDLGYTIGDAVSFTRFITNLRHFVAEHPDKEDILYHQVLAKQRAEQPARWLHIKLEVVEDKKTLSTTLLIRDDDLYVHGFMNQEGVCYELLETKDSTVNMIPEDEYNPHPLYWGLTYNTILNVQDGSEATAKLVTEGLGMSFAIEAVRRLSSSTHPDVEVDGEKSARVALAGLIVMVCESARMNPLRDAIAGGWSNGTGFTEQLMDRYVRKYGEMSRNLQKWKSSNSDNWPHPISELQATCLVLNTQLPDKTVGRPRVELLSIHADLGVVGTKIIVFDGKRGQIIYRHNKQREQGTTENLVLTGPYTGISAYLCFAIKIDIPDAGPMVFKWDCYNPQHAAQVGKPPMSHDMGNIAKVTYAVMSNALKATVQVKLRLNDEHSAAGIGGEITALIDGFEDEEDNRSILFRPEKRTCQSFSSTDNDSMILLQLARNVLAVPYGKDLRIKVDLEIETSNNQGIKNLRAYLCIANGILSQCHIVDGGEVEVNVTWYPQEEITSEHQHEVVYTIGDARSYRGFIMALCRILTNHPDREGILDGSENPNPSTRQHPLLLTGSLDRWLHIKLQVAGEGTSVILAIGMDDLRVHGFRNQNGYIWYLPNDFRYRKKWLLSGENLHWGYGYDSILGVNSHEGIVGKLASETQGLGKTTAVNAVRVLSRFRPHVRRGELEAGGDKYYDARVALVCLSVMVCDSAKLNPVLKHIESGWENGTGLTKELEGCIKEWNRISSALQDWKEDSYRTWKEDERLARIGIKSPADALDVVHLCSAERMRRF